MILTQKEDNTIIEMQVPDVFSPDYDVIVVGLGVAGAIAAITAGEQGLAVLGIELLNCMGGMSTAGGVLTYYYGGRGGRFEDIDHRLMNPEAKGFAKTHGQNPELRKIELERQALKAGVKLAYNTTVLGVYKDKNRVLGVKYSNNKGIYSAFANYVIDATGDAHVCRLAGCSVKWGRKIDQGMQPYSNCILTLKDKTIRSRSTDCGFLNQFNPESFNREILYSSTLPLHLREDYLSEERVLYSAEQLGIREGAYIIGEETVKFQDFIQGKETFVPVFYAYANLDNHRKDLSLESELQQEWIFAGGLWGLLLAVPIPLKAMIPKEFQGIIVAGRCIAVDHDLSSFTRMKRDCQKSGEVAAIAVNIAIKSNKELVDIPYEELTILLKKSGCLDVRYQNKMQMMDPSAKESDSGILTWEKEFSNIRSELGTNHPGIAIYSLYRMGVTVIPTIVQWLKEAKNEQQRRNIAIALGLLGDRSCLPILREIVRSHDFTVGNTSAMFNQMRIVTAIYFLGNFMDEEILPDLMEILCNQSYCENYDISLNQFIPTKEDAYFQLFTASAVAMIKIGRENDSVRQQVVTRILGVMNQTDFSLPVMLKPTRTLKYEMKEIVKNYLQKIM